MWSHNTATLVGIVVTMVLGASVLSAAGADTPPDPHHASPAVCGAKDTPETGIQGDVPREDQSSGRADAGYNCGLSLLSEIPVSGVVQGADHCLFIRTGQEIRVYDLRNPARPKQTAAVPTYRSSETMRVMVTKQRAIMVSGSGVYDIRNCAKPVFKGEIPWPQGVDVLGIHDIRISLDAKKVYAGVYLQVANISNLDDPKTWTTKNFGCDIPAQEGHPVHATTQAAGIDLCDHGWQFGPTLSHSPSDNPSGTRMYIAKHSPDWSALHPESYRNPDEFRILDMTKSPPKIITKVRGIGGGHSIDWFRTKQGRQFALHAGEISAGPTCLQHPRPHFTGFGFEAFMTEVTGDKLKPASMLELAINKPENCAARLTSGSLAAVGYHVVDNQYNATIANVSFESAGLRVFDIRNPYKPVEVAYYNRGGTSHAGISYYDAVRGIIMVPGGGGVQILELEPQVLKALKLSKPKDRAYPRFPKGRPAQL